MKFVAIPPAVRALIDARMKIATGWCQGGRGIDGDKRCAMTAMTVADYEEVKAYLEAALPAEWRQKPHPFSGEKFINFNDDPSTTQQTVLDWFDRAIALAALELETIDVQAAIV